MTKKILGTIALAVVVLAAGFVAGDSVLGMNYRYVYPDGTCAIEVDGDGFGHDCFSLDGPFHVRTVSFRKNLGELHQGARR